MRLWQRLVGVPEAGGGRVPVRSAPQSRLDRLILDAPAGPREQAPVDFGAQVAEVYQRDGIVFAVIAARMMVFSQGRFLWRRFEQGRPQALFGDASLGLVERPWTGGTTASLLTRMEQDGSLAGNCYLARRGQRLRRMRPDWVTILVASPRPDGSPYDLDADVVGYVYDPPGSAPQQLMPDEVAHFAPIPDPLAQWRGMSWLTPVIEEVEADRSATRHKLNFFRRGATPGLAVTYDRSLSKQQVEDYIDLFDEQVDGVANAYRTLHLGGGADPKVVGADLQQVAFKATQGHGETRIAAAGGTHPVIVGLSEGMQGSSLNAGNYMAIRRRFADGTIRPLWTAAAGALERVMDTPAGGGAQLWWTDLDSAFMQEDQRDEAVIRRTKAGTVNALLASGWTAESAVAFVESGDLRKLEHTGLLSVQLQNPRYTEDDVPDPPEPDEGVADG